MAYDAYSRFLEAVKKFPRWTNARRRPIESNGGKILRSIIEEIAQVEDAIREYKKDFFLINYIGREEELLDYIYTAQVGDIEDLDAFTLDNPSFSITEEEAVFIQDKTKALYRDGYVFLYETNEDNRLQYTYEGEPYTAAISEQKVWNCIDEFAWWYGLERFDGERNASLLQRCLFQFQRRPNSSLAGIRNTIRNAAYAKTDLLDTDNFKIDTLQEDEIQFLPVNETTLALKNEDGISLYEEISQFNRDIARTRKWDLDYWSNAFRELHYLPHVWDAPVDIYKDGVGYRDALHISTVAEAGQAGKTDVTVSGYIRSIANVDSYIRNHHIMQQIGLKLTRYDDMITPVPVRYRITAEDLFPIDPDQVSFLFYQQSRAAVYDLDQFVTSVGDGITEVVPKLKPNSEYELTFAPADKTGAAMEIKRCDLIEDQNRSSLLTPDRLNPNNIANGFVLKNRTIINEKAAFHGDKIVDFLKPVNLQDTDETGITLIEPLADAVFYIPTRHTSFQMNKLPIEWSIDQESGWEDITTSNIYITSEGFTYDEEDRAYLSAAGSQKNDKLTILLPANQCRELELIAEPDGNPGKIWYKVEIQDDKKNWSEFEKGQSTVNAATKILIEPFRKNIMNHNIRVTLYRPEKQAERIRIRQIRRRSFYFTIRIKRDKETLRTITEQSVMTLPVIPQDAVIECTLHPGQNPYPPIIQYVHVGQKPTNLTYKLTFSTENKETYRLDIRSNCDVTLRNKTNGEIKQHYITRTGYQGSGTIVLDLSSFTTLKRTEPAVKKANVGGMNQYLLSINTKGDEVVDSIYIQGVSYRTEQARRATLRELVSLEENELLYITGSFDGIIGKDGETLRLISLQYDDMPSGDRIEIRSSDPAIQCCFRAYDTDYTGTVFTGVYDSVCLYNPTAKQYLSYVTEPVIQQHTEARRIHAFSPAPADMERLCYRIDAPNKDADVYFIGTKERRNWTIFKNEPIGIDVSGLAADQIAHNVSVFTYDTKYENCNTVVQNTIDFADIIQDKTLLQDLGAYQIQPPDTMEVHFRPESYPQDAYEDGSAMYVKEDGFTKLKYANIQSIDKIIIGNVTYDTQQKISKILTLIPDAGIICWNDKTLIGEWIKRIEYTYKKPIALRFKNLDDLYKITGYAIEAQELVGSYTMKDQTDGSTFKVDLTQFDAGDQQVKIVVSCTEPCYHASLNGTTVQVSRIAENYAPVIHNGFYYVDGKEHYYFTNAYPVKSDKWDGVSIQNGTILNHTLYMYKQTVNYLENSKMELNHMDYHCLVDFTKKRTNADPLGHIGACEVYAMWNDYNADRKLTTYKNGYATQFTIQDNGYAILDITSFLEGHRTISCLYNGSLQFALAKEIRILGEQAWQTVYCEPVQAFTYDKDVAYCVMDTIGPERVYLVVTGKGVLDEVLIHDETDPKAIAGKHIKTIDRFNLSVPEQEAAAARTVTIEYDPSFTQYNQLETTREGYLRVGMTTDWNITKVHSFDLPSCRTEQCLYRSGAWTSQKNGAVIETTPFSVKYSRSVYKGAVKINELISGNRKGFTIYAYSSRSRDGVYQEIGHAKDSNSLTFNVKEGDKFLKFRIVADEGKVVTSIGIFFIYRESREEALNIFNYTDGSAVTRIFSIGAAGNYRFAETVCDNNYADYDHIYVRGIKKASGGEYIWGPWKDTETHPEFNEYELFQFKIVMKGQTSRLKIRAFQFEVL